MVLRTVAAHDENAIGILDIYPVVCHSTTTERLCQSRYSGAVSDTGLVVYTDHAQAFNG